MLLTSEPVTPVDFTRETGWELQPQGACRGAVCVPLPAGSWSPAAVDVGAVASALAMPVVTDAGRAIAAVGPSTLSGRALATVEAPDVTLPLVLSDGVWRLAAQRGRRTVVVAWAPW
jgi:hypothetical protein